MGISLTITLPDDRYSTVENMTESGEATSKSDAVNILIERGERVNELEARNDDLRRQLTEANARNEHVDELAEYVDEERGLRREIRERRREKESTPLWTRLQWYVFGRQ